MCKNNNNKNSGKAKYLAKIIYIYVYEKMSEETDNRKQVIMQVLISILFIYINFKY